MPVVGDAFTPNQGARGPALRRMGGEAFVPGGNVIGRAQFEHPSRRPACAPLNPTGVGMTGRIGKDQSGTRWGPAPMGAITAAATGLAIAFGPISLPLVAGTFHVPLLIAVAGNDSRFLSDGFFGAGVAKARDLTP